MKAIHPVAVYGFEERPPHPFAAPLAQTLHGCWIRFGSEIISGSAILVPCGNGIDELRSRPAPRLIVVETGVKAYENFRLLEEGEAHAEWSQPLPTPGDYDVVGQVAYVLTDETGNAVAFAKVFVGSLGFDLNKNDFAGIDVEEGAWVRFQIRGLSLYDVDY